MATRAAESLIPAERLKFVDGLRGIAALMVVVYHLAPHDPLGWVSGHGYLGVGIFFVLSGFVITSVIGDVRVTGRYFGRFVLRRCVRLDIPYWLNIPVVIALGAVVVYFGAPERRFTIPQVIAHIFYLQTILGYRQISPVYWTLCFEIQFYLSMLLLIWIVQRAKHTVRTAPFHWVLIATIALSLLFSAGVLLTPRGLMFGYWWAFAIGAMTWLTVTGRAPWPAFAAVVLMTASVPLYQHADFRITGALTATALFAAAQTGNMARWLADPVTQFLGRISYSLYLFHGLTGGEAQKFADRYMGSWTAFAIGVAVSVATAWVAYRLIEKPAIRLSRRIKLSASIAPTTTALTESTKTLAPDRVSVSRSE